MWYNCIHFVLICFSFWHSVETSWDWGVAICTGDLYPTSQRISCKAAVALVNWTRNARTFVPHRVRLSQPRAKKADKRKTQSLKQLYNTIVWDIASEKLKTFTSCWRDGDWVALQIILRAMEQCVRVWDNKLCAINSVFHGREYVLPELPKVNDNDLKMSG